MMGQLGQEEEQKKLQRLRERSQMQLVENLNKTEATLSAVKLALRMQRLRNRSYKPAEERKILSDTDYTSLGRSIAY